MPSNTSDQTLHHLFSTICERHPAELKMAIERYRRKVSVQLAKHHQNTIQYGPFKGLRLDGESHWSEGDRGAMVLGLYEQEVLNLLKECSRPKGVFINLGAADGYYAIGVLIANLFAKAIAFEITEEGQNVIRAQAEFNHVTDRLTVLGKAEIGFAQSLSKADLLDSVVLCDIEGGEFEVFTPETFQDLQSSTIVIELHEWFSDAEQRVGKLIDACAKTHTYRFFRTGSRDLSHFPELVRLDDNTRWLICGEGRPYHMRWIVFEPT